jgi:two-component system OmpR family response regulator
MVACALDITGLAEAAHSRGLALVPMAQRAAPGDAAAVLGWSPHDGQAALPIADARARGWTGPLMVAVDQGCGAAVAEALDAGADDAVLLPASAGEIAARLAARLRGRAPDRITLGELAIDPVERSVSRGGRRIALLPREYALLVHLARARGRCVSRAELLEAVWRLRFDPGTNVVEVHVSRLRAKLDRGAPAPMLVTERGRGYRLTA